MIDCELTLNWLQIFLCERECRILKHFEGFEVNENRHYKTKRPPPIRFVTSGNY